MATFHSFETHPNGLVVAVFDDPYTLRVEFVEKRGKTECELWFAQTKEEEEEGNEDGERGREVLIDPLAGSGGGPVDVAAFALRIAIWSLFTYRYQQNWHIELTGNTCSRF